MSQKLYLIGGFNHFEKYESQWEGLSHILIYIMENKIHVPTHQPVNDVHYFPIQIAISRGVSHLIAVNSG